MVGPFIISGEDLRDSPALRRFSDHLARAAEAQTRAVYVSRERHLSERFKPQRHRHVTFDTNESFFCSGPRCASFRWFVRVPA